MDVSLFDFELPEDRIALRPAVPRDSARMMVVRNDGRIEHRRVSDLLDYLKVGDVLVVNDTKVIAARLKGRRLRGSGTAGIEILLHRRLGANRFSALARPARRLVAGDELDFGGLSARVIARCEAGGIEIEFASSGADLDQAIAKHGEIPLPPYIAGRRAVDARDSEDYQTLFAREAGSVAAPTAGLHFTPQLLDGLARKGVRREVLTLHVGLGTFQPVSTADTSQHRMHAEFASLDADTARRLNEIRLAGGRVIAVGTTTLRTLESAVDANGKFSAMARDTDIFITPGYRFRAVDGLLTNFHLPRSTLFMLVSAFMGLGVMRNAYMLAISEGYRFYSYGDASLLLPG